MSDSETGAAEVVMSPAEAARQLGVSASGLRRLATVYAQLHGDLERDASGTSRVWPAAVVRRLESARALLAAGQARTVADALRAVEGGAQPSPEAAVALGERGEVARALGVVAAQLEAVLRSNARLEAEVEALRSEVGELRQLPTGDGPPEVEAAAVGAEQDSPVVRMVRWLERRLRGRG